MTDVDIPLSIDELYEHTWIRTEAYILNSIEEFNAKLKACKSYLNHHDILQFVKEYSHMFVTYLRHRGSVDPTWFKTSFQVIVDALTKLKHKLNEIFDEESLDVNECYSYRNTLRVLVFLLSRLCCARQRLLQGEKRLNALNLLMRTGKDQNKEKNTDMIMNGLSILYDIASANICLLWIDEPVDTSFLSALVCPFLQDFEKGTFLKNRAFNNLFVSMMEILCTRYNYEEEISTRLSQSLKYEESCSLTVAECVRVINPSVDMYLELMMIELVNMRFDHAKKVGNTFYKNFAVFLNDIAHTMPNELLKAMDTAVDFLSEESYQARNAVLSAICILLETTLNCSDLQDEQRTTREMFFDTLVSQFSDPNFHVRSQMLQYFRRLTEAKAVPVSKQITILKRAARCLKDPSSLVRKHSLALLLTLANNNGFTKDFDKEKWRRRLDKELQDSENCGDSTCADIDELAIENADTYGKQELIEYIKDCVNFVSTFFTAIPHATAMLRSKLQSDIIAALDFLVKCAISLSISNARKSINDCLHLVWHPERTVRDALINAFVSLHLDSNNINSHRSVQNLMSSFNSITRSGLLSVEVILNELIERKLIDDRINKKLLFFVKQAESSSDQKRKAFILLHLLNKRKKKWIKSNIDDIVNYGIVNNPKNCVIAECYKLITSIGYSKRNPLPDILPTDNIIFTAGLATISKSFETSSVNEWSLLAGQFLNAIRSLAQDPISLFEIVINNLCAKLNDFSDIDEANNKSVPMHYLIKLCSIFGMVAIAVMHFIESRYVDNLRMQHCDTSEKNKEEMDNLLFTSNPQGCDSFEQFGDDAEDLKMNARNIFETQIFAPDSLLSCGLNFVKKIIEGRNGKFSTYALQYSAHLALIRMVMISVEELENHLEYIFQCMEELNEMSELKASMIMIIGDLFVRYPNTMEPWNGNIYKLLRDASDLVRTSALRTIARLVLRDMIKVRGQISEVAVCIIDLNPAIRSLSRYFFEELARRSNGLSIYNVFPDILSRLSDKEHGIDHEGVKSIMSYLIKFITKEKQRENLVDRLCQRLKLSEDRKQWADISYCLSVIVQSERAMKKLNELFPLYAEKLHDDNVYRYFRNLITSRKRHGFKQVNRLVVEEFSDLIEKVRLHGLEDADGNLITVDTIYLKKPKKQTRQAKKGTQVLPSKKKKARRSRNLSSSSFTSQCSNNHREELLAISSLENLRKRPPGRNIYVDLSSSNEHSS